MAKIILQPWVSEHQNNEREDRLERMRRLVAIYLGEAQRRYLQLPDGEDMVRSDPEFTDEHRDFLLKINAGQEPPRIKEIRLDRSERNLLRELGNDDETRKFARSRWEADFLLAEAETLAVEVEEELERRDPHYPPMRRRQLETLLAKFEQGDETGDGISSDLAQFLHWALFTPGHDYGIQVTREGSDEPLVWDVRADRLHALARRKEIDELEHLVGPCGRRFVDLEQNQNLRMLLLIYMACPTGESPVACEECLPEGVGSMKIVVPGLTSP